MGCSAANGGFHGGRRWLQEWVAWVLATAATGAATCGRRAMAVWHDAGVRAHQSRLLRPKFSPIFDGDCNLRLLDFLFYLCFATRGGDYMFPARGWARQGAQTSVASRCERVFHSSSGWSHLSSACASDLDRVWYHVSTYPRIHVSTYPRLEFPIGRFHARESFHQSERFVKDDSGQWRIGGSPRRSCRSTASHSLAQSPT